MLEQILGPRASTRMGRGVLGASPGLGGLPPPDRLRRGQRSWRLGKSDGQRGTGPSTLNLSHEPWPSKGQPLLALDWSNCYQVRQL